MSADKKIRLLLADDQRLVRDGIASLLSLDEEIDVVGTAENGLEAVELAGRLKPDICLLDIRMPVMDGISVLQRIMEDQSCRFVIMLTTFDDREYVVRSLKAGAVGYLLKDLPSEELSGAVKQAVKGVFIANGTVMKTLMGLLDEVQRGSAKDAAGRRAAEQEARDGATIDGDGFALSQRARLSEREREVLSLLGEGLTNGEIAESLGLSEGTVKNYISSILTSLGFRDRVQAALFAARNGNSGKQ
ncbi:MAG: response regulator transcription factor [Spirochaetales bacterium]|nr:response regulator transcription factor [Spirochaetales bacterium]